MSENIEKKIIRRVNTSYEWGEVTELIKEENYSVNKYEIKHGTALIDKPGSGHYVIASGAAEFFTSEKSFKIFTGEKASLKDLKNLKIQNCGVIPLIIIETCLI